MNVYFKTTSVVTVVAALSCQPAHAELTEVTAAAIVVAQSVVSAAFKTMLSKFDVSKQNANATRAANEALNRHTIKAVADAQNMAREERAMRFKSADLARAMEMPPNVCETATAGLRVQSGEDNALRLSKDVATAMASRTMKSTNPVAAMNRIAYDRLQWGDDNYDNNVNAATLMNSKSHSPIQSDAAQIFIRNVVDPKPVPMLPASASKSADGRVYEAAIISRNLKLSAATAVLSRLYADRKILPDGTTIDSRQNQNPYQPVTGKAPPAKVTGPIGGPVTETPPVAVVSPPYTAPPVEVVVDFPEYDERAGIEAVYQERVLTCSEIVNNPADHPGYARFINAPSAAARAIPNGWKHLYGGGIIGVAQDGYNGSPFQVRAPPGVWIKYDDLKTYPERTEYGYVRESRAADRVKETGEIISVTEWTTGNVGFCAITCPECFKP